MAPLFIDLDEPHERQAVAALAELLAAEVGGGGITPAEGRP